MLSVSAIGCGLGCIAAAGTAISVPGLTTVAAQAVVFASMLFGVVSYSNTSISGSLRAKSW